MLYNKFIYLYPPRPEVKIPATDLDKYDNGEYVAMPKYNGSACMVFTNGTETHLYNRHKQQLANVSRDIDFKGLSTNGKWQVYCGEYLNKSKLGENDEKEKDKFVIWDILVCDGIYLIGMTLDERLNLLENIFPTCRYSVNNKGELVRYEYLSSTNIAGIYKAPTFINGFQVLYNQLVKTDLYEGVVLKKINSKLTFGYNERNNMDWQLKSRKETKNYNF